MKALLCRNIGNNFQEDYVMLMKKLLPIFINISCAFSGYEPEYRHIAKDSNLATELCIEAEISVSRDKARNAITCNDISLAQFSLRYVAADTFRYFNLISYGKKVKASTRIMGAVLLLNDGSKTPFTVYVLTKL